MKPKLPQTKVTACDVRRLELKLVEWKHATLTAQRAASETRHSVKRFLRKQHAELLAFLDGQAKRNNSRLGGLGKAVALGLLSAVLFTGCAISGSSRLHSEIWETNKLGGITHEVRDMITPRSVTWGDASQSIDKMRFSNGKTLSVGYSGFDVESTTTNLPAIIKSGGELIGQAAATYTKSMGVPALPVPAPAK